MACKNSIMIILPNKQDKPSSKCLVLGVHMEISMYPTYPTRWNLELETKKYIMKSREITKWHNLLQNKYSTFPPSFSSLLSSLPCHQNSYFRCNHFPIPSHPLVWQKMPPSCTANTLLIVAVFFFVADGLLLLSLFAHCMVTANAPLPLLIAMLFLSPLLL